MTVGRPWRAGVWVPVIAMLGVVFCLLIPMVPGLASTTRPVEQGERVYASAASFVPATQWTLDLDAATSSRPQVTRDSVSVTLSDGIWFGSSADLLDRVTEQLAASGITVVSAPSAPEDDSLVSLDNTEIEPLPRAEYSLGVTAGSQVGEVVVIREDVMVAIVRSLGPESGVESSQDAIDAMVASVDTGYVVDNLPTAPQ